MNLKRRTKIPVRTVDDLPEDVLYAIFYGIASDLNLFDERLTFTLSNSWVCQKWRRIILESPAVWGRLLFFTWRQSFTPAPLVSIILNRSGNNSPLWIVGDTCTFPSAELRRSRKPSPELIAASHALIPTMTTISTEHWHRIERLDLHFYHPDLAFTDPSFFASVADLPAQRLRHFRFQIPPHNGTQDGAPIVFEGCSPFLQVFSLRGVRFMFRASSVARLNSLELWTHNWVEALRLLPSEIPLLETFIIDDTSNTIDEQKVAPIRLPKLRRLHVSGSPEACQAIVRNTYRSSPKGCFVTFELAIPQYHHLSTREKARTFVQEFYEPLVLNNLELLEKAGFRLRHINLTLYFNTLQIESPTRLGFPLEMTMFWDQGEAGYFCPPLLQALKNSAVSFAEVNTLCLNSPPDLITSGASWDLVDFLTLFPNVTVVQMRYLNNIPIVYLNEVEGRANYGDEEKRQVLMGQPFPRLRKLRYFDMSRQDINHDMDPRLFQRLARDLRWFLWRRVELGAPVEEIELLNTPKNFALPKELATAVRDFSDLKIWSMPKDGSCGDRELLSGSVGARARNHVHNLVRFLKA